MVSKQVPDKNYFVELVYTHMPIIYKICNLYAREDERDDLKQEIIYQLWKSYSSFRGESKFQSWMYRVALNTAMLGLRARKMTYTNILELDVENIEDPIDDTDDQNRIGQLYRQIAQLGEVDKTIIFLYLEQCSYEEIAEITGISAKNVSVRLVRIRAKLKNQLHIQNSEK